MTLYEILQIPSEATEAEIKGAYRRLAKLLHPDSGSPGDVDRFRQVQHAYETLSDPERRRAYDRTHTGSTRVPVCWSGGFEEPQPIFRRRGFEEVRSASPEPPVQADLLLTESEARRGGSFTVEVPAEVRCPRCEGAGFDFFGACPTCVGVGVRRVYERLTFVVPRGVEDGEAIGARRQDGGVIRARVRLR